MHRIPGGTRVLDVRGRALGSVLNVRHCCIEIEGAVSIERSSIFNVTDSGIELVCDADQLDRYFCRLHNATPPRPDSAAIRPPLNG